MIIIGAGMAGLLAANMLRRHRPTVIEKSKSLPNNHSAVLRFRTNIVSEALRIPFRQVNMIKAPVSWKNPVADALMYSYKNTGMRRSDRSITSGLVSEVRYIAPPDLIQQMAEGVDVNFNIDFDFKSHDTPVISTIPMPFLGQALNYQHSLEFKWTSGATLKAKIQHCDAYVSLLVPDPCYDFTRLSITGDELFIELHGANISSEEMLVAQVAGLLGIPPEHFTNVQLKPQKFSKINPIDDNERKKFMHWATVNKNIYSLGRFATWRPGLLLDDLVNDIRLIEKWIVQGHKYEVGKAS